MQPLPQLSEDQQKILQNFVKLEEDLVDSEHKNDFEILREAWNVEIQKPGCTQCIKNSAQAKYAGLATLIVEHKVSIEQAKEIQDLRVELSKEHQIIQQKINAEIQTKISDIKNQGETANASNE